MRCDPLGRPCANGNGPEGEPEIGVRCYAELANYLYPKRKAVDLATEGGQELIFEIERVGLRSFYRASAVGRISCAPSPLGYQAVSRGSHPVVPLQAWLV